MIEFSPLSLLLTRKRPAQLPLVLRDGEVISWGHWRARVAAWHHTLAARPGKTWALYHSDAGEFSAALFALWSLKKVACVPGSNQPLVVRSLMERVDGFIGEFENVDGVLTAPDADFDGKGISGEFPALELDDRQAAMEVFTSGSSGEPQAIAKQLYQLSREVENLERVWGGRAEGAAVIGTVSHQHIYGLLFRVLWPLAAGRCFDAQICEYLEDVPQQVAADRPLILISSPTHLSRVPEGDWSSFTGRCRGVYSSGAPLSREASLHSAGLLGHRPIEVYGSSETGGIGWRQQSATEEINWQPMPGIAVSSEPGTDCLRIQSPYLPAPWNVEDGAGTWYVTSDRVQLFADGCFGLRGRVDRIAKIEGKRVSMPEMEALLCEHDSVAEARLVELRGHRTELGAVVVLSSAGGEILQEQGRRALNRMLQAHLFARFERPVLPRRWRFVAALPRNSQGKITRDHLLGFFDKQQTTGEPGLFSDSARLPTVIDKKVDADEASLTLSVLRDLLYFDGHFPSAPILPGVVQTHWAEYFGRQLLGFAGEFSHLEAIKFQHVIVPEMEVALSLRLDREKNKLYFSYSSGKGQHSSGRIIKHPAAGT